MEVANQILYVAGTSTVVSFTLLVSSEEFIPAAMFLYRHPGCMVCMAMKQMKYPANSES